MRKVHLAMTLPLKQKYPLQASIRAAKIIIMLTTVAQNRPKTTRWSTFLPKFCIYGHHRVIKRLKFDTVVYRSPTRMMVEDVLMPGRGVNVGVYLRRGDAFVSQHFLHDTKVSTMFHKMCGE